MLEAIIYLSISGAAALPDTCGQTACFATVGFDDLLKAPRGKPVTVSRKSRDPVNIPVSSGRFRPVTEANQDLNVTCQYWCGRLIVSFCSSEGFARVMLEGPSAGDVRIYKTAAKGSFGIAAGESRGSYTLTVRTSFGNEYIFTFELTD